MSVTSPAVAGPILLGLDEATRSRQIDRAEARLGDTLRVREKFRKFVADVASEMKEPHIRKYLEEVVEHARAYEEGVRELFGVLGREPPGGRSIAGTALAKGGELIAEVVGLAGGARGNGKDLRQLLIESQDTLGAFAIVEQIGYALGLPRLAEPAFRVVAEKTRDHLLIREFVLEMAPVGILLHRDA